MELSIGYTHVKLERLRSNGSEIKVTAPTTTTTTTTTKTATTDHFRCGIFAYPHVCNFTGEAKTY